jgi:hypothetical protein
LVFDLVIEDVESRNKLSPLAFQVSQLQASTFRLFDHKVFLLKPFKYQCDFTFVFVDLSSSLVHCFDLFQALWVRTQLLLG